MQTGVYTSKASHLSYTSRLNVQCQAIVKVHGWLSVLLRVPCIFTASSFHLEPRVGDSPAIDDAIRAGRNLPDKEFRYLRTVIVTGRRTGLR